MVNHFPTFLTIRKTAATGILSEHHLRLLVARRECPGIWVGNRFMVNVDALADQLNRQSQPGGEAAGR